MQEVSEGVLLMVGGCLCWWRWKALALEVDGSLTPGGGKVHVLVESHLWLTKSIPIADPVVWPRWKTEGTVKFSGK